jgi:hypothetical protein
VRLKWLGNSVTKLAGSEAEMAGEYSSVTKLAGSKAEMAGELCD